MLTLRAGLVVALCLVSACSGAQSVAPAAAQSVCQLYATRSSPNHQPVLVHATAWVALRHGGALLQDASCPKIAIGFRFADEARDRPLVKKFSDAMTGDVMNLKPRLFDVHLKGTYSGATEAEPNGLFVVSDVEGFKQQP